MSGAKPWSCDGTATSMFATKGCSEMVWVIGMCKNAISSCIRLSFSRRKEERRKDTMRRSSSEPWREASRWGVFSQEATRYTPRNWVCWCKISPNSPWSLITLCVLSAHWIEAWLAISQLLMKWYTRMSWCGWGANRTVQGNRESRTSFQNGPERQTPEINCCCLIANVLKSRVLE